MNTVRISTKSKHKEVPNRNHTSEEYKNWLNNTLEGLKTRLDEAEQISEL